MAERKKTQYVGTYYREELKLGSPSQYERVYYIRYRLGGRGSRLIEERVGRESEGMTAARASHIRADRARGRALSNRDRRETEEAVRRAEAERPTIARLWALYRESRPDRQRWDSDISRYRLHIEPHFGAKTPADIVTLDVDRLRAQMTRDGKKPSTIKGAMDLLQRLVRFGAKKGLCPMPEISRLHFNYPQVDDARTENMTARQMRAYLQALDEEPDQNAAAFLRLALATGMRKSALLGLRWDDIDFDFGFITLRGELAKKRRTERIPLSAAARKILRGIDRIDVTYVFPGKYGGPRKEFKKIAERIKEKAGLPADFRPLHGLRHTFASWLASSGEVDLYTLQKLLTHNSPQMTQRYAHLADAALHRAASVVDRLFVSTGGENEKDMAPQAGQRLKDPTDSVT
ncbi:Site-specific recombinase XerD [uncultured delta proteobacterium]|uniref:Site-specific recombinase XerD n=1 Tax=uncultured delta proteobacterium TaxID=34034 RepID=A0A212KH65_9DELT|nr:Site-specific recombinase XerD [uncultured delta proteobacterium]